MIQFKLTIMSLIDYGQSRYAGNHVLLSKMSVNGDCIDLVISLAYFRLNGANMTGHI